MLLFNLQNSLCGVFQCAMKLMSRCIFSPRLILGSWGSNGRYVLPAHSKALVVGQAISITRTHLTTGRWGPSMVLGVSIVRGVIFLPDKQTKLGTPGRNNWRSFTSGRRAKVRGI